jgi:pilus assembly protein CpaB
LKPSVLISIALLIGAVAVFLVARWIGIGGSAAVGPRVVVAASMVDAGMPLAVNNLRVLQWPSQTAPQGGFDSPEKVVGRVTRQPLVQGEPILESRLAPVDMKGGLSATLEAGKRAITVRVNDVIGVAGFALPGSYVDVLVSARDTRNEPFSKIVLYRVKVLAVAQETAADPAKPKVVSAVTLELTPAESERLDLARSVGSLSLALRNELDRAQLTSSGTRLDDLMHEVARAAGSTPDAITPRTPATVNRASATRAAPPAGQTSSGVEEYRGIQRGIGGEL